MNIYLQGLTMGLAYVAPIGMQNLFVINTALTQSKRRAIATALIVIFFDATLSFACFFGVGTLMQLFPWCNTIILLIGSVIVMYMGYGLLKSKSENNAQIDMHLPWKKVIMSACIVSWCNPQAVLDGTMLLGAFRVTLPADSAIHFLIGVITASAIWFLSLTGILSCLQKRFPERILKGINILSGVIMLFYGGKLFWEFVQIVRNYDML